MKYICIGFLFIIFSTASLSQENKTPFYSDLGYAISRFGNMRVTLEHSEAVPNYIPEQTVLIGYNCSTSISYRLGNLTKNSYPLEDSTDYGFTPLTEKTITADTTRLIQSCSDQTLPLFNQEIYLNSTSYKDSTNIFLEYTFVPDRFSLRSNGLLDVWVSKYLVKKNYKSNKELNSLMFYDKPLFRKIYENAAYKERLTINCQENSIGLTQSVEYNPKNNKLIKSMNFPYQPDTTVPGSIGESIVSSLCLLR